MRVPTFHLSCRRIQIFLGLRVAGSRLRQLFLKAVHPLPLRMHLELAVRMIRNAAITARVAAAFIAVCCLLPSVSAAQGTSTGMNGASTDGNSNFNAARPGNATVNANGQPIGKDTKVLPGDNGKQADVPNLSGGTSVNPYTGVPVGQPLRPNDIGRER